MKVLFSPEYRGHVFLGVNEENALLMDVMVCDTTALIGMLELRLGIHVEDHPGSQQPPRQRRPEARAASRHPAQAVT